MASLNFLSKSFIPAHPLGGWEMRQVTIKALYRNLSKEMADLPFEVTKNGEHLACVVEQCIYVDDVQSLDKVPKIEGKNHYTGHEVRKMDIGLDQKPKKIHNKDWVNQARAMPKHAHNISTIDTRSTNFEMPAFFKPQLKSAKKGEK